MNERRNTPGTQHIKVAVIPISLEKCARCKGRHKDLPFFPLENAPKDVSHYALCPVTKQPVLLYNRDVR